MYWNPLKGIPITHLYLPSISNTIYSRCLKADWDKPTDDLTPDWPQSGELTFENYETRYREGLELVLKGINFNIKSGEKVHFTVCLLNVGCM